MIPNKNFNLQDLDKNKYNQKIQTHEQYIDVQKPRQQYKQKEFNKFSYNNNSENQKGQDELYQLNNLRERNEFGSRMSKNRQHQHTNSLPQIILTQIQNQKYDPYNNNLNNLSYRSILQSPDQYNRIKTLESQKNLLEDTSQILSSRILENDKSLVRQINSRALKKQKKTLKEVNKNIQQQQSNQKLNDYLFQLNTGFNEQLEKQKIMQYNPELCQTYQNQNFEQQQQQKPMSLKSTEQKSINQNIKEESESYIGIQKKQHHYKKKKNKLLKRQFDCQKLIMNLMKNLNNQKEENSLKQLEQQNEKSEEEVEQENDIENKQNKQPIQQFQSTLSENQQTYFFNQLEKLVIEMSQNIKQINKTFKPEQAIKILLSLNGINEKIKQILFLQNETTKQRVFQPGIEIPLQLIYIILNKMQLSLPVHNNHNTKQKLEDFQSSEKFINDSLSQNLKTANFNDQQAQIIQKSIREQNVIKQIILNNQKYIDVDFIKQLYYFNKSLQQYIQIQKEQLAKQQKINITLSSNEMKTKLANYQSAQTSKNQSQDYFSSLKQIKTQSQPIKAGINTNLINIIQDFETNFGKLDRIGTILRSDAHYINTVSQVFN